MKSNIKQSYLIMFNLLDEYYDLTKNDTLGELLGSWNPDWSDDLMPFDIAVWDDWITCIKKITSKNKFSCEILSKITIEFLNFYKNEFGYDLEWIVSELQKIDGQKKLKDNFDKITVKTI